MHPKTPHDAGGKRKPKWPAGSSVSADFSDCGKYRYSLSEVWDETLPLVMFLMMNPSVANVKHADPTLIKTGKFARRWGFGGQLIGNVHSYRITNSKLLADIQDPVGPLNDRYLAAMASRSDMVVLAYGLPPKALRPRSSDTVKMLRGKSPLKFLRLTKNGTPSHPLYLQLELNPREYLETNGANQRVE